MSSNPKPVYRMPEPEESALNYCESIAFNDGWQSLNTLLKAINVKPVNNWFLDQKDISNAVIALVKSIGLSSQIDMSGFKVTNEALKQLKLCPICVLEKKPHLSQHQYPFNTHCPTHQVLLMDSCPICSKKITSTRQLSCLCCHSYLFKETDAIPQNFFSFAMTLPNSTVFLKKLMVLAGLMLRPWDIISEDINWNKLSNKEISLSMEIAYQYLSHDNALQQYDDLLRDKFAGNAELLKPVLDKKCAEIYTAAFACSILCELPVKSIDPNFSHSILSLLDTFSYKTISKKRLMHTSKPEELNTQCTGNQVADAFCVSHDALKGLVENNDIFKPLDSNRVLSYSLFCIETIMQKIGSRLPSLSNKMDENYVCINQLSVKSLKAFGLSRSCIFIAAINNELKAKFLVEEHFEDSRFYLQRQSLLDFLWSRPLINDNVSIETLSDILLVPTDITKQLIGPEMELYFTNSIKSGLTLLDESCVEQFLRNYLSINRISWLYRIMPSEVINMLRSTCGTSTIITLYSNAEKKNFVFVKIDECINRNLKHIFTGFPDRIIVKTKLYNGKSRQLTEEEFLLSVLGEYDDDDNY
ncbi:MAG: TniQ family protein [Paraglaciecola sp.]|nr:TniQ family protein [Paraglaciecola sp.]